MSAPWYREFYSSINQAENVTRSPVSFLFLLAHPFLVKFRLEGLVSVEIIHSEPNRAINQSTTNHHNLQILGFIILLLLEMLCKCFWAILTFASSVISGRMKKIKTFSENQVSHSYNYCYTISLRDEVNSAFSDEESHQNQWDYSYNLGLEEQLFSFESSRQRVEFYMDLCEKGKMSASDNRANNTIYDSSAPARVWLYKMIICSSRQRFHHLPVWMTKLFPTNSALPVTVNSIWACKLQITLGWVTPACSATHQTPQWPQLGFGKWCERGITGGVFLDQA